MTWSYVSLEYVINCYEMGNSAQTSMWANKNPNPRSNKQSNKQCGKTMYTPSKSVLTHCVGV